jgi:nitroreductase
VDVFEALKRRRMYREFTPEPVDSEALDKLTWAAARAPMGGRELVRRIVVITSPTVVKTLREVTPSLLVDAPAIMLICTDLEVAQNAMGIQGRDILSLTDAGAAAENVALAAVALGLGVCFFRSANEEALRVVLELPESVRPDILIAIGHPPDKPPRALKAPKPIVYRDVYGRTEEESP